MVRSLPASQATAAYDEVSRAVLVQGHCAEEEDPGCGRTYLACDGL